MSDKKSKIKNLPSEIEDSYDVRGILTLSAAIMQDMKETDPEKHKRVSIKWHEILKDIPPNSGGAPSIRDFILDIVVEYTSEDAKK